MEKDVGWAKSNHGDASAEVKTLHYRALQLAGLLDHDIAAFKNARDDDKYKTFRDAVTDKKFTDKTDEEKGDFKQSEKNLLVDTQRLVTTIHTTCSKSADPDLTREFKPEFALLDEACFAPELETLLPVVHNAATLKQVLFIGDPLQLQMVILSQFKKDDNDEPYKKTVDQLAVSYFERMIKAGLQCFMLTEQFRMTEGLEQLSSRMFYKGLITNAPSTLLHNRLESQAFNAWVTRKTGVPTKIPHVLIDVPNGVTLLTSSQSAYNVHEIIVVLNLVKELVAEGLFKEENIAVLCPYNAQVEAFYTAPYTSPSFQAPGDHD